MTAAARKLEFTVEWLDIEDDSRETLQLLPTTPRAQAWFGHRGADAVVARVNALVTAGRAMAETLQDLIEADAGVAPTEPAPASVFDSGASGEFAVEFEDDPENPCEKFATIIALSDRALAWMKFQDDELVWRVSRCAAPSFRSSSI